MIKQLSAKWKRRRSQTNSSSGLAEHQSSTSNGEGSSTVDDDTEPEAMEKLISLHLSDLEELRQVEPEITRWLKNNLHKCHSDKKIKKRIKELLGTFFYVGNFTFLGVWNDLKAHCRAEALEMGKDMKEYFEEFNLGEVLGKGAPNAWGSLQMDPRSKIFHVEPCPSTEASRRQDDCVTLPFPRDETMSQLWNEKCYIHFLRMVGMGINQQFQDTVRGVASGCNGSFRHCPVKGYIRMTNKCISKTDHYYEKYPRPSLNFDVIRNASTFEQPEELLAFIQNMSAHKSFGRHPIRIKNMFLYDEERAKEQFHFRAVMVNWLFTPGLTYQELLEQSEEVWDRYYNYTHVEGFGDMDVSEPWGSWREQIKIARTYLESEEMLDQPVQLVVETQLLLRPYLHGRQKMHLLYQIIRADTDEALYHDFSAEQTPDDRSYDTLMDDAVAEVEALLADDQWDPNTPDSSGDSKLWQASYWGYDRNAELLLEHSGLDINEPRASDQTTPLYMAADKGHDNIVRMLLARPELDINQGSMGTDFTALFAAADNGRERVVAMLLEHPDIDVNKPRSDLGFTPIYMAAQNGNERVIQSLLAHPRIDVNLADLHYGATPLTIAATNGHEGVVRFLLAHPGIEVNRARTDDGNTPLLMAASYGHAKVTELLLDHPDIDVNKPNTRDGCTPLFMSSALGFTSVVAALVKVPGVDVNKGRETDGTTPLYWAKAIKNVVIEELLLSHPDILQKSFHDQKSFREIMGLKDGSTTTLVNAAGENKLAKDVLADVDVIGLYFSAHWCPPCRGFTPQLTEKYKALKEAGKSVEMVFVSRDPTPEQFKKYLGEMPWWAVPFAQKDCVEELNNLFEHTDIPHLVFVEKSTGNVITNNGCAGVSVDTFIEDFPYN